MHTVHSTHKILACPPAFNIVCISAVSHEFVLSHNAIHSIKAPGQAFHSAAVTQLPIGDWLFYFKGGAYSAILCFALSPIH